MAGIVTKIPKAVREIVCRRLSFEGAAKFFAQTVKCALITHLGRAQAHVHDVGNTIFETKNFKNPVIRGCIS